MAKKKSKAVGRPPDYTEKLAKEICGAIAENVKGLQPLCDINPHWPIAKTIRRWIRDNEEFRTLYMKAKEDQCHLMAEEMLLIADDTSRDIIIRTNKNGEDYEACNSEFINRSRVRIDTRKWLCAKLMPKQYGDRTITESTVKISHEDALKELE